MSGFLDLTNKRFGFLIVKERTLNKNGRVAWKCFCNPELGGCGNFKVVKAQHLTRKCFTKSCGCLKKQNPQNRIKPFEALYKHFLLSCNNRKINVCLSYKEFVHYTQQSQKCEYCGESVNWTEFNVLKHGSSVNFDRRDSNIGYVKENIVICCSPCNYIKHRFLTYEEMKIAMAAVIAYRKNKYE